jgi:hypothetical protein
MQFARDVHRLLIPNRYVIPVAIHNKPHLLSYGFC